MKLMFLLMFLLPVAIFTAIVAALWVARLAESRARRRMSNPDAVRRIFGRPLIARKPFSIIRIADAFEPEISMIWETQVPALTRICAAGCRGMRAEALRPQFMRFNVLYPELYEGAEFESWLKFLEEADLIRLRDEMLTITPAGIQFLKCRVTANAAA